MELFIVTGSSRGLGEAIVDQLLAQDTTIIGLSRNTNPKWKDLKNVHQFQVDLSDREELSVVVEKVLSEFNLTNCSRFGLFNNAGILGDVGSIGELDSEQIIKVIDLNLAAPLALMNSVISQLQEANIPKTIVNISSGAGRSPYFGWGSYCATKAALDMLSKCVSIEQNSKSCPFRIYSIAPGVIDTDMQGQIRQVSKDRFPSVERFVGMKEENLLWSAEFVAENLVELVNSDEFGNDVIQDIRSFVSA